MKRFYLLLAATLCTLMITAESYAVTYTWDANGAAAGTGGTGTWDITSFFWNNGVNTWPAAGTDNDAVFGGTVGTVSIAAGGVTANDLTFSTTGYTIQNNTLTLNGDTAPVVTLGSNIAATINSAIAGSAGLTYTGVTGGVGTTSTLTLGGTTANTYTGTTRTNAGILVLSKPAGTTAVAGDIAMSNTSSPTIYFTTNNQLGGSGVLRFVNAGGNARFNLFGTTQSLAGLNEGSAVGVVQNSEAANGAPSTATGGTLNLTGSGSYFYNGHLRNLTGSLTVNMNGTGTQTFSTANVADRFMLGTTTNTVAALTVNSGTTNIANTYITFGEAGGGSSTLTLNGGRLIHSGGGGMFMSNATGATSVFDVTGGQFIDNANLIMSQVAGITSTINLSGGSMSFLSGTSLFGNVGNAVWAQTGGTANFAGQINVANSGASSSSSVTVSGGTFNQSASIFYLGVGNGGTATMTISGTGRVNLLQLNLAYQTGATSILNLDGGTLQVNNMTAHLGNAGGTGTINFDGGVLRANGSFTAPSSAITTNVEDGGAIFDTNGFNVTIATALADAGGGGGLTKMGSGTLTLSGANTFTGATTVTGGGLTLDYTTQNNSKLSDSTALTLGGAAVTLTAGSHTEVVASTTLNAGGSSVTRSSGTGVLRMNAITRNAGATINFGAASIADTDTSNDASGILGSYATVAGADWATSAGAAADTAITAYAGYTAFAAAGTSSAVNYSQSGSIAAVGTESVNTLKVSATGAGQSLAQTAGTTLTFSGGGLLATGANAYTISGGTLSSAGELMVHQFNTGGLTISSSIGGATTLIKAGTSSLSLTGANTHTGGTTLNAGTLNLGSATALGSGTFTINGGTLNSSVANLANANNNAQTWNGDFTFTGTQNLNLGTGNVSLGTAAGTSRTVTVSANTLTVGGSIGNGTTANTLVKTGTGNLVLSGNTANAFSTLQVNQGAVYLSKTSGAAIGGDLVFDNNLSPDVYTTVDNQFAPGAVVRFINNAGDHGRLDLMGTTQTVAGIDNSAYWAERGVIQNSEAVPNAGSSRLVLNGSGDYRFYGYLRDATGRLGLTMNGTGTQMLAGGNINYTGTTIINSGKLSMYNAGFNSPTTINAGGTLENSALSGNNGWGGSAAITLNGGTLTHTGSGYLTLAGAVTLTADSAINVANSGASNQLFLDNGLYGVNRTLTINNGGSATTGVHFRNNPGAFSGAVIVNGGDIALQAATANTFVNTDVTLNNADIRTDNSAFAMTNAANANIKSLSGTGNVFMAGTTLTLGMNNGTGSFAGVIQGAAGNLVIVGSGTQTLTGSNTYTGTTSVNGGTLKLDFSASGAPTTNIIATTSALSLGGGTLEIKGGAGEANTQTFNGTSGAGGTLQLTQNGATSINVTLGAIGLTGSINFAGSDATVGALGTANFLTTTATAGNNGTARLGAHLWNGSDWASTSGTGGTHVVKWIGAYSDIYTGTGGGSVVIPNTAAAEIRILEGGAAGSPNTLAAASTTVNSLLMTAGTTASTIKMDANSASDTLVVGNGAGAVGAIAVASGAQSLTIGQSANQGSLTAGSSGASILNLLSQNASPAQGLVVNSMISNNAGAGVVSVVTGGPGLVTLAGNNGYTGTTTIGGGTLQIGTGGTSGTLGTGAVTDNGTLAFNRSDIVTVANNISGGGNLIQAGAGTIILTGANSYAGTTTISAGILQIGNGGAAGTLGAGNVVNNAALTFNRSDNPVVANLISGTGTVTKSGAGTLYLTNSNTYGGGTTISAGTLSIGNNTAGGSAGSGAIVNNSNLQLYRSGTSTFSNNVSGSGTLYVYNNVALSGNTINLSGALRVGGNASLTVQSGVAATFGDSWAQHNSGATSYTTVTGGSLTVTGAFRDNRDTYFNVNQSGGTVTLGALYSNQTEAGNAGGFGGNSTYTLTGGQLTAGAISGGGGGSFDRGITLNLGGGTLKASGTFTMNANTVNLTGVNGSVTIDSDTFTLSTSYGFTGNGGLNKTGTGTLQFLGAQGINGSGQINIQQGTIKNNNNNVNWSNHTGNINISGGAILDLYADAIYLNALSGSGTVQNDYGNASGQSGASAFIEKLVVGVAGGSDTFSGTIRNNSTGLSLASGAGRGGVQLEKTGTGTQTLTGTNTYSGATIISGGSLQLGSGGATGALTGTSAITNDGNLTINRSNAFTQATDLNNKAITGTGTFTQAGSGTTTLSLVNSYSGATTVSAGTLVVNGSINNSSVTVQSGATIEGSGSTGPLTIQSGGFHNPGNSPSFFDVIGTYSMFGTLNIEFANAVAGSPGSTYDQVRVKNPLAFVDLTGGTLGTSFSGIFAPAFGDVFTIIDNQGGSGVTGNFTGLLNGATLTINSIPLTIYYNGNDGNDVVLVSNNPTPMPINLYVDSTFTSPSVVDGNRNTIAMNTAYVNSTAFSTPAAAQAAYSTASANILMNADSSSYGPALLAGGGAMRAVQLQLVEDTVIGATDVIISALSGDANDSIATRYSSASGGNLVVDTTVTNTFSGVISGAGNVTKRGTGTLTLDTSTNSYTGATYVAGGTLELGSGGSIAATSLVDVGILGNGTGDTLHLNNSLHSGNLGASNVRVGVTEAGLVDADAGTYNIAGNLEVGVGSPGTVTVNGSTLNVTGQLNIGGDATTGGTAGVAGSVTIGAGGFVNVLSNTTTVDGGPGLLAIGGGFTDVGSLIVGDVATGIVTHTAGTASINSDTNGTATGDLVLGQAGTGSGQYNLSGGTLFVHGNSSAAPATATTDASVGNSYIGLAGVGEFNHSGGTFYNDTHMTIAAGSEYNLTSGSTGTLDFRDTQFGTQQAATDNVASTLTINSTGAFNFDGGTLMNVSAIDTPGGTGVFTQAGTSRLVIGVDGGLTFAAVRALTTISGDYTLGANATLAVDLFGPDVRSKGGEAVIGAAGAFNPVTGLGGTNPFFLTDSDLLHVLGDVSLSGTLDIDTNGTNVTPWGWYDVIVADSFLVDPTFTVTGVPLYRVIEDPSTPGRFIFQVGVPEPASVLLWSLIGLVGLAGAVRQRRRA